MKVIGEKLKEAREAMGISISEASEDLKLEVSQIENLEEGDMENVKDIYYLKYLIRDYSKYLGLNKEDLVNEFNEYLFDYTSKISLEDIKQAQATIKNDDNRIKSPYTTEHKKRLPIFTFIVYALAIIILVFILIFVIKEITKNDDDNSEAIVMSYTIGGIYEFTK